jgi:hypothetical protein
VRRIAFSGVLILGLLCPWPAHAQPLRGSVGARAFTPTAPQVAEGVDLTPSLLSLSLPGAGQHVLGQPRKWAYVALEVAGWAFFIERRRAGGRYRDRYRDFAWENGRIQSGSRVDGDFDYYERLAHWTRSGAFDRDASSPGVQPELDDATFNGSVWSLATRIHGASGVPEADPAYQSALAYYAAQAYGAELLWDWTGAPGTQVEYAGLLDTSDSRFRQATTVLGVVIANHIVSAADAYVSSRSRSAVRLRVIPDPVTGAWSAVATVAYPR